MKILYCINGTFNSGEMKRVIIDNANYLAEHGYNVFIITVHQQK